MPMAFQRITRDAAGLVSNWIAVLRARQREPMAQPAPARETGRAARGAASSATGSSVSSPTGPG